MDKDAVAVYDGDILVGHVPAKLNLSLLSALKRGIPVLWQDVISLSIGLEMGIGDLLVDSGDDFIILTQI